MKRCTRREYIRMIFEHARKLYDTKDMTRINKAVTLVVLCVMLNFTAPSIARTTKIQPLAEKNVRTVVSKLNKQGIVIGYDETVKKDKVLWYNKEYGSFGIENNSGTAYWLYEADINNDKQDECIVTSSSGSGGFFDIEAIYKIENGKFIDSFDQIKIPMRKLIRDANKETYDLEDGYAGFMGGSIDIETIDGKTYFTLTRVRRDYGIDDHEKSFQGPEVWKFLWDKRGIRFVHPGVFQQ